MFKIVAVVLALGSPHVLTSNQSFDTKEACEAAMNGDVTQTASVAKLKADLEAQGIQVDGLKAECADKAELDKLAGKKDDSI